MTCIAAGESWHGDSDVSGITRRSTMMKHARTVCTVQGAADYLARSSEVSEVQLDSNVSRLCLKYFSVVILC